MSVIVVMPGGFHPFHAGHYALYQAATRAFPKAEVYVAATNDTSARPFPFPVKEKLAKLAGVAPGHFVQVKSPFRAEEITAKYNPNKDILIFVRSEKDATKPPQAGGTKKDGTPAYLQPLVGQKKLEPFSKHAYMAYLPTVEFGPGMTSATEIRTAWPQLNDKRKQALVMSLYPATQKNPKLAQNVVKLLDTAILPAVSENQGWAATFTNESVESDAKVYQNKITGKYVAWVDIGKKQFKQEGDTKEEALQNLITYVQDLISQRKNVTGNFTTVGFNGPFVSGVLKMPGKKFFARFDNGKLLVSDTKQPGFRPVSDGIPSPTGIFPKNDILKAGLSISSRYDIIPVSVDLSGIRMFNLKHHSDVLSANDRLTRNTPSLTIQMTGRHLPQVENFNQSDYVEERRNR